MDVSVIIITRNTCALTGEAVRSVLAADSSVTTEIFVVDNGSNDDTATVLPREFPQIQLLRFEKNLGFARAVNLAVTKSSGEFLVLLNSDARLTADALTLALKWLRANPNCAVLNKSLLRRLWPEKFPGKEQTFPAPVDVETVVGAFMLIRRAVWDVLGGLDERFFFFFEETDFCRQVRRKNLRVMHLPQVRVWHGQGQTAKQVSVAARIEYWRSRYLYFAKNSGRTTRLVLRTGLLARLAVDWLAALLIMCFALGRNSRWHSRWQVCSALAGWHLRGCPSTTGLLR